MSANDVLLLEYTLLLSFMFGHHSISFLASHLCEEVQRTLKTCIGQRRQRGIHLEYLIHNLEKGLLPIRKACFGAQ